MKNSSRDPISVVPENTFSALVDLILYFHGIFG
jgi:hypothetical protein